ALADQPQLRQPLEQRRADLRTLADQHQRLGVLQPLRKPVDVLDVVVPDRDVMAPELWEAIEGAYRVEVIVEDGDLHDTPLLSISPRAARHRISMSRSAGSRRRRRALRNRARPG